MTSILNRDLVPGGSGSSIAANLAEGSQERALGTPRSEPRFRTLHLLEEAATNEESFWDLESWKSRSDIFPVGTSCR